MSEVAHDREIRVEKYDKNGKPSNKVLFFDSSMGRLFSSKKNTVEFTNATTTCFLFDRSVFVFYNKATRTIPRPQMCPEERSIEIMLRFKTMSEDDSKFICDRMDDYNLRYLRLDSSGREGFVNQFLVNSKRVVFNRNLLSPKKNGNSKNSHSRNSDSGNSNSKDRDSRNSDSGNSNSKDRDSRNSDSRNDESAGSAAEEFSLPDVEEIHGLSTLLEEGHELGRGGQAIAYRCKWEGKDVCVKISRDDASHKQRHYLDQLLRDEACFLHKCSHSTLKLLAFSRDPFAIVTEYMSGGSLKSYIANSANAPFSPMQSLEIVCGVFDALNGTHALHIAHFDVKPDNILLDDGWKGGKNGRVVLGDFGVSRDMEDITSLPYNEVGGTPGFRDPRTAKARLSADLHAMGKVIACLLLWTNDLPMKPNDVLHTVDSRVDSQRFQDADRKIVESLRRACELLVITIGDNEDVRKRVYNVLQKAKPMVPVADESTIAPHFSNRYAYVRTSKGLIPQ